MADKGDINIDTSGYSINWNNLITIIEKSCISYYIFYIIAILISLFYLYTIRIKQNVFNGVEEEGIIQMFKSIGAGLFGVENYGEHIGLNIKSYTMIVGLYIIALIIILIEFGKNQIYYILVNFIQSVIKSNPYNDPDMVSKMKDGVMNVDIAANNRKLYGLLVVFFVPFLIPYFLKFFDFDNYDVVHNKFASGGVLFLLLIPFIFIIFAKFSIIGKGLDIFNGIDRYVEVNDIPFINKVKESYKYNSISIYGFIWIILISCYLFVIVSEIAGERLGLWGKIIFGLVLFILIPIVIIFFNLSVVMASFNDSIDITNTERDGGGGDKGKDINRSVKRLDINGVYTRLKKGVSNVIDLIIKYNYSCVPK